jgi:hypothetical protein
MCWRVPGGTGTRWLVSIRIRSPLGSSGSIESPSTVIIRSSLGGARNAWRTTLHAILLQAKGARWRENHSLSWV